MYDSNPADFIHPNEIPCPHIPTCTECGEPQDCCPADDHQYTPNKPEFVAIEWSDDGDKIITPVAEREATHEIVNGHCVDLFEAE